ncbi:hypothetical protein D3C86_1350850 [compost metagenome]
MVSVIKHGSDEGTVDVAAEESHQDLLTDARQKLMTKTGARTGHGDPEPGGARCRILSALPMEAYLYPRQRIGEDFLSFRTHHDGGERPRNRRARRDDRRAIRNFMAHAYEAVVVACRLIR